MWVTTQDLPRTAAHPFYTRMNQILDKHDFDGDVEGLCVRHIIGRLWLLFSMADRVSSTRRKTAQIGPTEMVSPRAASGS